MYVKVSAGACGGNGAPRAEVTGCSEALTREMVIKLRSSAREVPAPNSGAISLPFSTFLSKV